jgi:hypothetical protein
MNDKLPTQQKWFDIEYVTKLKGRCHYGDRDTLPQAKKLATDIRKIGYKGVRIVEVTKIRKLTK